MDDKQKKKQAKKFKELGEEWRNEAMGLSEGEIYKGICKRIMNSIALEAAKTVDEDLAQLKEQVKVAEAVYKDGKKQNINEIEFLMEVLRSRGVDVPSVEDFQKKVANGELDD